MESELPPEVVCSMRRRTLTNICKQWQTEVEAVKAPSSFSECVTKKWEAVQKPAARRQSPRASKFRSS